MGSVAYRSLSALIVDDQEFVLKIVTTILNQIEFGTIRTAVDGESAKAAVEASRPDLIICDINMKPLNGLGFLKWLRNNDSAKIRKTPLIFLTGEFSQELVEQGAALGCNMFLLKPVTPKKLHEKINDIFEKTLMSEEEVKSE